MNDIMRQEEGVKWMPCVNGWHMSTGTEPVVTCLSLFCCLPSCSAWPLPLAICQEWSLPTVRCVTFYVAHQQHNRIWNFVLQHTTPDQTDRHKKTPANIASRSYSHLSYSFTCVHVCVYASHPRKFIFWQPSYLQILCEIILNTPLEESLDLKCPSVS